MIYDLTYYSGGQTDSCYPKVVYWKICIGEKYAVTFGDAFTEVATGGVS